MRNTFRLTLIAAALTGAAHAQTRVPVATLADGFAANVACSDAALATMRPRVSEASADKADVGEALRLIAQRDALCAPVRDAATKLVDELFRSPAAAAELGVSPVGAAPEVTALIADAFLEADRASARLTFDSPPPPRHLTRGRISTP